MSDTMSDTVSDTVSDTMSDTVSDTVSDISDELQQDLEEALKQFISIKNIHDNILEKLSSFKETISDTLYIIYDGHPERDFDIILNEIYEDALKQVETTGHNPFGSMLLTIINKAEFKYSNSII